MKKIASLGVLVAILLAILLALIVWSWPDDNLRVIFCDVGQGDATLIIKGSMQMVVDGGPDDKVLDCITRYVPFYDRQIEMLVVTHPESDHMSGFVYVLQRYVVEHIFINPEIKETGSFAALLHEIEANTLQKEPLYTGNSVRFSGLNYKILWPDKHWFDEHTRCQTSCVIDDTNMNGFGIVGILTYGDFDVLLTADVDQPFQDLQLATGQVRPVEVLKVPHHGSKTGMKDNWLDQVSPKVAVISNGKQNRYGHPSFEAIDQLQNRHIKILRTDQRGDIEIVSDGRGWWVVE